jgi:hypothetical protein
MSPNLSSCMEQETQITCSDTSFMKLSADMEPDKFKYALKSNDAWASYKGHQNDTFFPNLAKGQAPEICKFCAQPFQFITSNSY